MPYEELSVVGYGPVPAPIARPNIVPMVFRRGQDLLYAPYRLTREGVVGAAVDKPEVLDARVRAGTAAKLEEPVPARAGHLLWIDNDGHPYYGPREQVLERLRDLSDHVLEEGEEALRRGDNERALELAQKALRVDEENVYALVLSAAAYRRQGNEPYVSLLAESAQKALPGLPFQTHVDRLLSRLDRVEAGKTSGEAAQSRDGLLSGLGATRPSSGAAA